MHLKMAVCALAAAAVSAGECGSVVIPLRFEDSMLTVDCTVNGRKCRLNFDTGAPMSFLHSSFARKEFPVRMHEAPGLVVASDIPRGAFTFDIDSFSMGDVPMPVWTNAMHVVEFEKDIGCDGQLGCVLSCLSHDRDMIISVGDGRIVLDPSDGELAGFGEPVADFTNGYFFATATCNGRKLRLLLDSGSCETFLNASTGWPKTPFTYTGYASNYLKEAVSFDGALGEPRTLDLGGMELEIQPNVMTTIREDLCIFDDTALIGLDTFLHYDMLVTGRAGDRRIALRRNRSAPRGLALTSSMCFATVMADGDSFRFPAARQTNDCVAANGVLDGRPCRILIDPRQGMMMVDIGFARREFPDRKPLPPSDSGTWQAKGGDVCMRVLMADSLVVGGAEFSGFVLRTNDFSQDDEFKDMDVCFDPSLVKGYDWKFEKADDGSESLVFTRIREDRAPSATPVEDGAAGPRPLIPEPPI